MNARKHGYPDLFVSRYTATLLRCFSLRYLDLLVH